MEKIHKSFTENFRIVVDESEFLIESLMKSRDERETKINLRLILEKFPFKNLKFETIELLTKSIVALHLIDIDISDKNLENLNKVKSLLNEWGVEFDESALIAAGYVLNESAHSNMTRFFAQYSSLKIEELDEKIQK